MNTAELRAATRVERYWTWSQERFPLINFFSAYLLYALTASTVRHELYGLMSWQPFDLIYGLALALAFLVLRVLDEHKDYESDLRTHPQRVLQRGIVNLAELRSLGWLAGFATLAFTLLQGSVGALLCWLFMALWAGLMTKEFFCGAWLKRHLLLYSVSHMMVLPLMVLWGAALADAQALSTTILPWLLALTFTNGLIYEILRKTKGQDEELDGVDTFSKRWGSRRAAAFGLVLHLASLLLFVAFSDRAFALHLASFVPLALTLLLALLALINYMREPTARHRKANEGASALFVLVAYVSVIFFSGAL